MKGIKRSVAGQQTYRYHKEFIDVSRSLSRRLRTCRLQKEKRREPLRELPKRPDIFFEQAANGTYPIVAFRTAPCSYYLKGYCHPCGYSARSYPEQLSRDKIERAISQQLDWLLGNFDSICLARADGNLKGYLLHNTESRPTYMLQLAGMSSFFSDREVPPPLRKTILERLQLFQKQRHINLHLMLETRPEHLVTAADSGELSALRPLLHALNAVVNMGFEAHDDFLRNVIFAKNMERELFERAVIVAQQVELDPGVFLYAGGFILTTAEVLAETRCSLAYLHKLAVFANLMAPNIQQDTIPSILYETGAYTLPEPYFLLDLAEMALDYNPLRPNPITPFHWFLGGLVSDPAPLYTIWDHPRRRTSVRVTDEIAGCLRELIIGSDIDRFKHAAILLRQEKDYNYHCEDLNHLNKLPWALRFDNAMVTVRKYLDEYADNISVISVSTPNS